MPEIDWVASSIALAFLIGVAFVKLDEKIHTWSKGHRKPRPQAQVRQPLEQSSPELKTAPPAPKQTGV